MEIKYNINEEKGTVVAYFDGGKQNVKEHMECQMLKLTYNTYDIFKYIDKEFAELDDSYFVGKAKVNLEAGDTFNADIGKFLAKDRLIRKHRKLEKRIANKIADVIERFYTEMITKLKRV